MLSLTKNSLIHSWFFSNWFYCFLAKNWAEDLVLALQSPILGYLWGIWILWFKGTSMVPIPRVVYEHHTNTMLPYQYHVTRPYHVILYHTKWPHTIIPKLSQGVWGPFSKYINYFCRLKYWSIRCHFLWKGSSCFYWDINLKMEAI